MKEKKDKAKKPAAVQKRDAATPPGGMVEVPKLPKGVQSVRGFRDILPEDQVYWRFLKNACVHIAEGYGFAYVDLPTVEPTALFERAVGKVTDIVEKEMFTFSDMGGDSLTLRPESTASMARAYMQHGMVNLPQPVKLYTLGSMFRYQRPQYGRQREFHQWACEVMGDGHSVIDATLIVMVSNLFADLGLPITVQINSIGDKDCRNGYRKALTDYYRKHRKALCEDCDRRLAKNPLRLLDCKVDGCRALRSDAPQFVDYLCAACKEHFMGMLEYLDDLDVPYVLNPHLVRGFDYYTRTVFEVWSAEDAEGGTALAGGGRYDSLLGELGGRPTPAAGLAIGMEVTILKLKERNVPVPATPKPEVFIAQLGEPARKKALGLYEELRKSGVHVAASFSKDSLKGQMELAARLGSPYAIIIGQKEIVDHTVILRDMDAGIQETFDFKKIIPVVQKKVDEYRSIAVPVFVTKTEPESEHPEN